MTTVTTETTTSGVRFAREPRVLTVYVDDRKVSDIHAGPEALDHIAELLAARYATRVAA